MQEILKKTTTWIRNNSGRLLLYAVILTGCFAIKYAAYGKYVDLVKDFTSVTSAPFYFSSNYLGEESEGKNYVIGTFDGWNYQLDVEIRNNDNAFNFNEKGKDFYYYVTAELFTDAAYTQPYEGDYSTVIKYGKNNEYAAAMAKEVKTYYFASESQIWGNKTHEVWKEQFHKNFTIDNSSKNYNDADHYKLLGKLEGLEGVATPGQVSMHNMADVKNNGKQVVRIDIAWDNGLSLNKIYLKVTAHTVPATTSDPNSTDPTCIKTIDKNLFSDYPLFEAGYRNYYTGNASCPTVSTGYENTEGIYATELVGKFELAGNSSSGGIQVKAGMSASADDYAVLYTFQSNANTKVRLYYDRNVLSPDDSLLPTTVDPQVIDGRSYTNYVEQDLFANGSKSCYFYKRNLGYHPDIKDVVHQIPSS